jgi:hypothetical protein
MGQYQQWLQCREADQQLRAQQEQLAAEMMRLLKQARIVADVSSLPAPGDNPIILALAANLDMLSFLTTPSSLNGSLPITKLDSIAQSTPSSIAPMQHTQEPLPPLDSRESESVAKDIPQPLSPPPQEVVSDSAPHPEMALLPEDMMMVLDEQAQTEPQLELPWWLRNLIENSLSGQGTRPIAQESLRANRLVERWAERWGHQSSQPSAQLTTDNNGYKKCEQRDEGQA